MSKNLKKQKILELQVLYNLKDTLQKKFNSLTLNSEDYIDLIDEKNKIGIEITSSLKEDFRKQGSEFAEDTQAVAQAININALIPHVPPEVVVRMFPLSKAGYWGQTDELFEITVKKMKKNYKERFRLNEAYLFITSLSVEEFELIDFINQIKLLPQYNNPNCFDGIYIHEMGKSYIHFIKLPIPNNDRPEAIIKIINNELYNSDEYEQRAELEVKNI